MQLLMIHESGQLAVRQERGCAFGSSSFGAKLDTASRSASDNPPLAVGEEVEDQAPDLAPSPSPVLAPAWAPSLEAVGGEPPSETLEGMEVSEYDELQLCCARAPLVNQTSLQPGVAPTQGELPLSDTTADAADGVATLTPIAVAVDRVPPALDPPQSSVPAATTAFEGPKRPKGEHRAPSCRPSDAELPEEPISRGASNPPPADTLPAAMAIATKVAHVSAQSAVSAAIMSAIEADPERLAPLSELDFGDHAGTVEFEGATVRSISSISSAHVSQASERPLMDLWLERKLGRTENPVEDGADETLSPKTIGAEGLDSAEGSADQSRPVAATETDLDTDRATPRAEVGERFQAARGTADVQSRTTAEQPAFNADRLQAVRSAIAERVEDTQNASASVELDVGGETVVVKVMMRAGKVNIDVSGLTATELIELRQGLDSTLEDGRLNFGDLTSGGQDRGDANPTAHEDELNRLTLLHAGRANTRTVEANRRTMLTRPNGLWLTG